MWISKKRFDELEKKCGCLGYLEVKLKECVNRIGSYGKNYEIRKRWRNNIYRSASYKKS